MDLHSARSSVDRTGLIRRLAALGAPVATLAEARAAGSAAAILEIATEAGLPLADAVAAEARAAAEAALAARGFSPKWTCSSSTVQAASLAAPAPEQPPRLLILGGTTEGRALATAAERRFGPLSR
ncbi:Cobalt-precorrin-5B C(1)-methyltransferase [Geodia barretti]|uniref:Cobalt-precorrin-5B C(1)-methyltransferase n=1 Tax=Geodia barretti TaxID=519541 RepID=A0AA35U0G6_GEOBA|nr:Cobalt-precorrin-5B C(1)-methyltransferase [Geodia barretti]